MSNRKTRPGPHLIYLYADTATEWNCSQWRALTPSDSINAEYEAGHTGMTAQLYHMPSALDWSHPEVQRKIGKGDVLIFQRNVIVPEVWEAMDYWRALGKTVVVDLDDHYPGLMPSNPAFAYWITNRGGLDMPPIDALSEGLRHADAVSSPSKVILEDWAHIVPGYWLPNWTRRSWYAPVAQKAIGSSDVIFEYGPPPVVNDKGEGKPVLKKADRPDSENWIVLGWGGSISHVDSWLYSGIVPALDRLFEKWPQLRLKFCGYEDRLNPLFLDRWGDRVIRQSGVMPEHWPGVVGTFDIGLAPLETRPLEPWREGAPVCSYDERRSWLKAVEYLSAGVPWAASRSRTYEDLADHGALTDNTPDCWTLTLDALIGNLASEKKRAWAERKWALNHVTFEANVQRYQDIIERLATETQARKKAQLPGIRYVTAAEPQAVTA